MTSNEMLKDLESELSKAILGQPHVIPRVTQVLKRGELNLTNPGRPKGNFLFLGPTGTGKTELTRVFTKFLFGNEKSLIRFDMSEYQTKESLELLIGDKSGWNGRLGEALLDSNGFGTLLFDEMEKAHREILDIFLQIMDDARLTTGTGEIHDLRNYYIVLTSNAGSDKLHNSRRLNFSTIERSIKLTLSQYGFRDEFIGRFNEVIVFKKLEYSTLREIAKLNLQKELKRLSSLITNHYDQTIDLKADVEVIDLSVMEGCNNRLGARPLRNYIETELQNALSEAIISERQPHGEIVVRDGHFYLC